MTILVPNPSRYRGRLGSNGEILGTVHLQVPPSRAGGSLLPNGWWEFIPPEKVPERNLPSVSLLICFFLLL